MEKLYTVNEIATLTRLSTRTIRRYLSNGDLTGQKIGRQWRFTQADLESFLDSQALIDVLDQAEQSLKHQFQTGKIAVDVNQPQADLTIIEAYETAQELQVAKSFILSTYNQAPTPLDFTVSIRILSNNQLRLVLFGQLEAILAFTQILKNK